MPRHYPKDIQLRQATLLDTEALAALLAASPDDGSLYRFPHILEHPEEMRVAHMEWLRPALCDCTTMIMVAVQEGDNKNSIVGFSSWQKHVLHPESGHTEPAHLWQPPAADGTPDVTHDHPPHESSSQARVPHKARSAAMQRCRARAPPSPTKKQSCYELNGLAVSPVARGRGAGTALMQWGLARAAAEGLPVYTAGEGQGVAFYEGVLGFRRLEGTVYWLDSNGDELTRDQVVADNEEWKKENGGIVGAELVWSADDGPEVGEGKRTTWKKDS